MGEQNGDVLEDHELVNERILVERHNLQEPQRRSGVVLRVIEEETGQLTYHVDLDGDGRTYVPDDRVMPLDVIPLDGGIMISTPDAELAKHAIDVTRKLGGIDVGPPSPDAWQRLPELSKNIGTQIAISQAPAGSEWKVPEREEEDDGPGR